MISTNASISVTKTFFAGNSKMAEAVHSMDWSQTPLGPIESWPQSLRTTVSLCLASNFPISIAWGPQRVQIYNDGYWPICGNKHPRSMGQDYKECWFSAWPAIGEAFEAASQGQTRFLENQRMFLDRYGYLEETFFTFSFSPILDESGGVGGLFHPVTELTQQTLAERRLNILRSLTDRTVDAKTLQQACLLIIETLKEFELDLPFVLLYTIDTEVSMAQLIGNVGIEAHLSISPAEVDLKDSENKGWPLTDVVHTCQSVQVDDLEEHFGSFSCGPYPELPKTALVIPIVLPGLKEVHTVFIAGVSSRRSLDEKYRQFYDLLAATITNAITKARAYEEESKRAEALAELDRAKTTFFSNISHEFRTPLTLMLGPLEDVLSDKNTPLSTEHHERLKLVQRNTLRLQRLVNGLLDFSRIESGRLKANFHPTDLSAYTRDLAGVFQSAMEKAELTYIIDCEPLPHDIYIDQEMWEKIIFNLLSNALKFTFEGTVEVRLTWDNGQAILQISDTGGGISKEELPNLFKRFYRIEGTKSRTHEGSGIGLAFVQELVKLHGGNIHAESELNKGTIFTISIPGGMSHLPEDRVVGNERNTGWKSEKSNVFINESFQWLENDAIQATNEINKAEFESLEINAEKTLILVVDDNADMRDYVSRILNKNIEWHIQAANDGLQALDLINKQIPDLILSDVMMPEMDGFQLLKTLRENPATSRIPVIFLSARAGEEATIEGLEKGADDYLVKPFSARELLARIRTHLEITHIRQDNTALRVVEKSLEDINQRLQFALDAGKLGAWELDLQTDELDITKRCKSNFGLPEEASFTYDIAKNMIIPEDRAKMLSAIEYAIKTQTVYECEYRVLWPDNSIHWILASGITIYGQDKTPLKIVGVTYDTTERKLVEQTLMAKNEQLEKTNGDLDNFIYTASHDLKAPIANLEGLVSIFEKNMTDKISDDEHDVLKMISASINRFKNTIHELTEISKLQIDLSEDVAKIDLLEVLDEIKSDIQSLINESEADIFIDLEVQEIKFSRKDIKSILYNLLSNALKYRSDERKLQIFIKNELVENSILLSVRDNGLGINLKHKDKLFAMFRRLHTHVEGSGVGLYIVKKIVENNGGKIEVESTIGIGSTFKIYFKS